MKKLTTFWVEEELLKEFKSVAVVKGESMACLFVDFMKKVVEESSIKNSPEYKEGLRIAMIEKKIKDDAEAAVAKENWKKFEDSVKDGTYVFPKIKKVDEDIKQKEDEDATLKALIGDTKPMFGLEEEDDEFDQSLKENL